MILEQLKPKEEILEELREVVEQGVKEQLKNHPAAAGMTAKSVDLEWTIDGILIKVEV